MSGQTFGAGDTFGRAQGSAAFAQVAAQRRTVSRHAAGFPSGGGMQPSKERAPRGARPG
jgi:hypothetical protein